MKDMYDRLGLQCNRTDGEYGVEVEVEGKNLPVRGQFEDFDAYWNVEHDGSLKAAESAEYVFKKPLSLPNVEIALGVLADAYRNAKSKPEESVRAGVHVHVNIQKYSPLELLTFATTYYVLEDVIVHWCGRERVGNHFCLRLQDAEGIVQSLEKACQTKDWRHLNTDQIRYASLNWSSMFKHGSLEFRCMRSTADIREIMMFVHIIDAVKNGAKKFRDPQDVLASFSEQNGIKGFINYVMGDLAEELLVFENIVNGRKSMEEIQPLVFMTDWDKFEKEKVNPFK